MPEDKTVVEPIQPIAVTIIGTGDGGAGTPITSGTKAVTADHHPDLVVTVISPLLALVIRFTNAYLTTLVGLVTAGLATTVIQYTDFLDLLWKCAAMSLAGPTVALLKDLITILGKLENKYPLATGSV